MGQKITIFVAFSVTLLVGLVATGTLAFADDEIKDDSNPFYMFYNFIQELKYDGFDQLNGASTSDTLSAAVIAQLKNEVNELTSRVNSLEEPAKIYKTELHAITDIDCSDRNNAEAFLSGWCPHPTRNIYFIEDSRVQKDSIIAISLDTNDEDGLQDKTMCGVINQDSFSFSFHDPVTGEVTTLEDLHGFIMKCDQSPISLDTVLRYTIVNS